MRITKIKKTDFYKLIKIWGFVSFIPVILAVSPLAGYFFGEYLEKKFGGQPYISIALFAFGFIAGAKEVIRILGIINALDKK